jgi:DNA-binding PadR family transcriptional regulator
MLEPSSDESLSPLTEATYFILLCLSQGPKHGYAIMKDVRALSEGRITLSTGTLYGVIKRLLEQGWIHPVTGPVLEEDGRGRRVYGLTRIGWDALEAEIARLGRLVAVARLRGAEGQA